MIQNTVVEKEKRLVSGFLMLFVVVVGLLMSTLGFVMGIVDLVHGRSMSGGLLLGAGIIGWLVAVFGAFGGA